MQVQATKPSTSATKIVQNIFGMVKGKEERGMKWENGGENKPCFNVFVLNSDLADYCNRSSSF